MLKRDVGSLLIPITKVLLIAVKTDIYQGLIAMDDNSITDQWLTNGEKWLWIKCSDYKSILTTNKEVMLERLLIENYHKATAQEIIEHFKL